MSNKEPFNKSTRWTLYSNQPRRLLDPVVTDRVEFTADGLAESMYLMPTADGIQIGTDEGAGDTRIKVPWDEVVHLKEAIAWAEKNKP